MCTHAAATQSCCLLHSEYSAFATHGFRPCVTLFIAFWCICIIRTPAFIAAVAGALAPWSATCCSLLLLHCAPTAAEEDIIAKLPCYGAPPASYDECIASGHYDELSCSAKDRAAGEYHSVSVLHVPGKARLLLYHNIVYASNRGLSGSSISCWCTCWKLCRVLPPPATPMIAVHAQLSSFFLWTAFLCAVSHLTSYCGRCSVLMSLTCCHSERHAYHLHAVAVLLCAPVFLVLCAR